MGRGLVHDVLILRIPVSEVTSVAFIS